MLWIELVCDVCSFQFEGRSYTARFKKSEYLALAARQGWKTFGTKQLCPLCFHEQVTGHEIVTGTLRVCLHRGCRLNRL